MHGERDRAAQRDGRTRRERDAAELEDLRSRVAAPLDEEDGVVDDEVLGLRPRAAEREDDARLLPDADAGGTDGDALDAD
ncbi:MAG: hypothetical protein AAB092_09925, partial [Chloroflexota bacterium]